MTCSPPDSPAIVPPVETTSLLGHPSAVRVAHISMPTVTSRPTPAPSRDRRVLSVGSDTQLESATVTDRLDQIEAQALHVDMMD